jgi:hypothetical protein
MKRAWLVLAGSLLVAAQAQAQTMYRCGSVYQDRPCDPGKTGRVVGSAGTGAAPATRAGGIDPECVQRGRDSNKIVWAREGGATEERLLSEATSARERRLIQNAYRRPGAASTVQAAVEADCVVEKQREEQEAALAIAAALKTRREGGETGLQSSDLQAGAEPKAQEQAAQLAAQQRADRDAEYKKRQCARYGEDMERLRNRERAGASASTMDSLNEQRRSLRERMSKAGC